MTTVNNFVREIFLLWLSKHFGSQSISGFRFLDDSGQPARPPQVRPPRLDSRSVVSCAFGQDTYTYEPQSSPLKNGNKDGK